MGPLNIHLMIADQEHGAHLQGYEITSQGRKDLPYPLLPDEQIYLKSNDAVAVLLMVSAEARERLFKKIRHGRVADIKVGGDILGIQLTKFEKGWPNQRPRIVVAQMPLHEAGAGHYIVTINPVLRQNASFICLASGFHPGRQVKEFRWENILSMRTDHERVILQEDNGLYTVIVTNQASSAEKLTNHLRRTSGVVLEINDVVQAFVVELPQCTLLYGFEALSEGEKQALGTPQQTSSSDLYPCHIVSRRLNEFAGLGWNLDSGGDR